MTVSRHEFRWHLVQRMAGQSPATERARARGNSHIDVSLHSLTWPHKPRKFTRPSHLAFAIAPNRLFSSSGSDAPVGSIPIARSTSRLASGYVGIRDWGQHVDPVGKRWERPSGWRRSRVLRCPYAAPAFTVQSHAAVSKNTTCDSHTLCAAAVATAGGRTRPQG
jgi:hypothetical protein